MRLTRSTIAAVSVAASAIALGIPTAAYADSVSTTGVSEVRVVSNDSVMDNGGLEDASSREVADHHDDHHHHGRRRHHHHHRRHEGKRRYYHQRGYEHGFHNGLISGYNRGGGYGDDRGGRDYYSSRMPVGTGYVSRMPAVGPTTTAPSSSMSSGMTGTYTRPSGSVRTGVGGSIATTSTPELAGGASLAALGLAGCLMGMRRRSSSR